MNALDKFKKTRGGAVRISLKFRVIMGIGSQTTFPVEIRTVKISNHKHENYVYPAFFVKIKIVNDFWFSVEGKVLISNEQVMIIIIAIIILIKLIFFIIYVPSQQLKGQLQLSVETSNYIMDKHNIKSKTNYMKALGEEHTNKQIKQ
jgi:hypothetical protein